jgi:hypothetical protein
MAWTEPKTWSAEPLVAGDLNTHLRDNLNAIKDPPTAHYELDESADYTTSSQSFVNVDNTPGKLSLTISTNGGDVLVGFHAIVGTAATGVPICYFDIEVDGNRIGGDDGICTVRHSGGVATLVSFVRLITGLEAGSHTFKLQWKVNTSTETLYAGAGTSAFDGHPQFWVREVS